MELDFIILAGGRGERMKSYTTRHKTLLEVNGISLLANHLLNGSDYLKDYLKEIYVVVECGREELEEEIDRIKNKLCFNVKTVEGDREGSKYGRSLYNALKLTKSNFVAYVMGDHWIDYEDLSRECPIDKIKNMVKRYDLLLFSDPDPRIANPSSQYLLYYDKKRRKVLDCGKKIEKYSHVDMGFFVGNKVKLTEVIKRYNLLEKDFDTSDFIRGLGKKFGIVEIKNVKWFGCNTPQDYLWGLYFLKSVEKSKVCL